MSFLNMRKKCVRRVVQCASPALLRYENMFFVHENLLLLDLIFSFVIVSVVNIVVFGESGVMPRTGNAAFFGRLLSTLALVVTMADKWSMVVGS